VDVRTLNLQVIHQLNHILRPAGSTRSGFVALPVIAIVDRDDAMVLCDLRRDAGVEPSAARCRVTVPGDHDPLSPCVR
jgi:hypothetical protein